MVDLEKKRQKAEEEGQKVAKEISQAQQVISQQIASNDTFRKSSVLTFFRKP